jgi:hypothetical protein
MSVVLPLVLLAMASPPVSPVAATAPAVSEPVSLPGVEGAIFSAAAAEQQLGSMYEKPYWQPTLDEVKRFEAALIPWLRDHPPKASPRLAKKLKARKYIRQYVGAQVDGRRTLIALLHCDARPTWTREIEMVKDGYDCHVVVSYDVGAGRITDVAVNGKA